MNRRLDVVRQCLVDSAVALDQWLSFKLRTNQCDFEVRFSTSGYIMLVAFIQNMQVDGRKPGMQPFGKALLYQHTRVPKGGWMELLFGLQ